MTREGAIAILLASAVLLLALMAWGWARRRRRDGALTAPLGVPEDAVISTFYSGLYVATTRHEQPLDRLAIRHLAFRSKARIAVSDRGVLLRLAGEPDVFLPADALVGVGRATWTIDRVVERDGLVVLAWRVDAETVADSYLRLQGDDPDALVNAISRLRPPAEAPAPSTGSDV